jgi:hypothetical protein
MMLDFPDPLGPTTATDSPAEARKDRCFKTGITGLVGYRNSMFWSVTRPTTFGLNPSSLKLSISTGGSQMTSRMSSAATRALPEIVKIY